MYVIVWLDPPSIVRSFPFLSDVRNEIRVILEHRKLDQPLPKNTKKQQKRTCQKYFKDLPGVGLVEDPAVGETGT